MSIAAELITIQTFQNELGSLGVLETQKNVPFDVKRIYFIYNVPAGKMRGAHGHKRLEQVIVPVCGSFDIVLNDGFGEETFSLDNATVGLHIKPGLWRDLRNFSTGAVALVLASEHYDEDDYIRHFDEFVSWVRQ